MEKAALNEWCTLPNKCKNNSGKCRGNGQMVERRWPTGIGPHGNGIRIRLWKKGKTAYTETLAGDPYNASDLASATKRRKQLANRLALGLPLREDDDTEHQFFYQRAQDYLDTLDAEYSTHLSYEGIINKYWIPAFGNWIDADIKQIHIKRELAKYPIKNKTKKNILVPLRGVLDHAGINPNPASIKIKKQQKEAIKRYRPDERTALLSMLSGQNKVYFSLLLGCGLRTSEALAATWPDFDGECIKIHQSIVRRKLKHSTKTHEARKVYIPVWARTELEKHSTRFANGFIFLNSQGNHYCDTDIFNSAWSKAHDDWNKKNRKEQIPYRIPYTCRHTRAAELLSTGVQPGDAAKQLGHTLEMFLRTYSEWIEEYAGENDLSRFEGVTVHKPSRISKI